MSIVTSTDIMMRPFLIDIFKVEVIRSTDPCYRAYQLRQKNGRLIFDIKVHYRTRDVVTGDVKDQVYRNLGYEWDFEDERKFIADVIANTIRDLTDHELTETLRKPNGDPFIEPHPNEEREGRWKYD